MNKTITSVSIAALALSSAVILTARFFQRSEKKENDLRTPALLMKRGDILAIDATPIARSVPCWEFRLDPQTTGRDTNAWSDVKVAAMLSAVLELDYAAVTTALARTDNRHIKLKTTTDPKFRREVGENARNWKLVIREFEAREYPLGEAAAQVLGVAQCEGLKEPRGLFGLEGHREAKLSIGEDIKTHIIPEVQLHVYDLLSEICASNKPECAWAVVAGKHGGDIYAMAGYPSFDPRQYATASDTQRRNHAAVYAYDPGDIVSTLIPESIANSASLVFKRLRHLGFGDKSYEFAGASPGTLINPEFPRSGERAGDFRATTLQLAKAFARAAEEETPVMRRHSSAPSPDAPPRRIHTMTAAVKGRILVITVKEPADDNACKEHLMSLSLKGLEY